MRKTVSIRLDGSSERALKDVAAAENRPVAQIVSVPLRMALRFSPAVRRAMFAIDGAQTDAEKALAAKIVGRAVLKAREGILDSRHASRWTSKANIALDSEAQIEAEATRLSKP